MTADIKKVLEVTRPGILVRIPAVQGDSGRRITFVMADLDIPPGSTATIYAEKPSGAKIYNSCAIGSDSGTSTVTVQLTSAMLEEGGEIPAQIQVISGEDIVTSFVFFLEIHKKIIDGNGIEGTNEFTALEEATQEANEAAGRANAAAAGLEEFKESVQEYINTGPIVVSEADIPVAQRKAGHWYFFVTESQSASGGEPSNDIVAGPNNMALKIVEED